MKEIETAELIKANIPKYVIINIPISNLCPFKNNAFKEYTGKKMADMIESVNENGIMSPLIVRPLLTENNKFEILSGHNRVKAATEVGLTDVPAIVRYDLVDAEDIAELIVIETNLYQRSFTDLSYSERCEVIYRYHEILKKQKKRQAFIRDVEYESESVRQVGKTINSDIETANNFGLKPRTVSRYLSIHKLSAPLKERLDNNQFGVVPVETIANLKDHEQRYLNDLLRETVKDVEGELIPKYKLNITKAKNLQKLSKKKSLEKNDIQAILSTQKKKANSKSESTDLLWNEPQEGKEKTPTDIKNFKIADQLLTDTIPKLVFEYLKIANPTDEKIEGLGNFLKTTLESEINEVTLI